LVFPGAVCDDGDANTGGDKFNWIVHVLVR